MSYKSFDDFFVEGANKNKESRVAFTRNWLKTNYKIEGADQEWVEQLSDVHDHDNEPLHFGQIKLGSAFSALLTQLVVVHNVWHIAIRKNNGETAIIHPLNENSSDPHNDTNRLMLSRLAKTGKVIQEASSALSGASYVINPTAILNSADTPVDDAVAASGPVSDDAATTSVSIDLSSYMKD